MTDQRRPYYGDTITPGHAGPHPDPMMEGLRLDMLDFPTAWKIQERFNLEHAPRCSSVPGWNPISGPHFLCDCGAVQKKWENLAHGASTEKPYD